VAEKRVQKIRAYTVLTTELKTIWNVQKVDIVPVIIGCTGTFYHGLERDLKKVDIENDLKKYIAQKVVLLGTAHIEHNL